MNYESIGSLRKNGNSYSNIMMSLSVGEKVLDIDVRMILPSYAFQVMVAVFAPLHIANCQLRCPVATNLLLFAHLVNVGSG